MVEPKFETGHQMWIYPKAVRMLLLGAMAVIFSFSLSLTLIYVYLAGIQEVCPYPVLDLRGTGNDRL